MKYSGVLMLIIAVLVVISLQACGGSGSVSGSSGSTQAGAVEVSVTDAPAGNFNNVCDGQRHSFWR